MTFLNFLQLLKYFFFAAFFLSPTVYADAADIVGQIGITGFYICGSLVVYLIYRVLMTEENTTGLEDPVAINPTELDFIYEGPLVPDNFFVEVVQTYPELLLAYIGMVLSGFIILFKQSIADGTFYTYKAIFWNLKDYLVFSVCNGLQVVEVIHLFVQSLITQYTNTSFFMAMRDCLDIIRRLNLNDYIRICSWFLERFKFELNPESVLRISNQVLKLLIQLYTTKNPALIALLKRIFGL